MIGLHFFLRLLGLTGLLVAAAGAVGVVAYIDPLTWPAYQAALSGTTGQREQVVAIMLAAGAGVALLALLIELLTGLRNAAGRRSVLGGNVVVQIALAIALLVGVNVWSFEHPARADLTRDRAFTLPANLANQLRQLRGETTVIVYLQHKSFGRLSDKPKDRRYYSAADRKVVEKVRDLVDQLRHFGPQFRVTVLDVEEEDFERKLSDETKRFPTLSAALESAPVNSIFFCAGKNVQRMSFDEFYELDKTASQDADAGRGNLVLLSQGVEPFIRRVLTIEEKKPRVAVGVIHKFLSTNGSEDIFSMAGVRKSLVTNGFEVTDIILKKWGGQEPEPAITTWDETRLDTAESEFAVLSQSIPVTRDEIGHLKERIKTLRDNSLDDLSRIFRQELQGRTMTEDLRQLNLRRFESGLAVDEEDLKEQQEQYDKLEKELAKLSRIENAVEGRRITDVRSKFRRMLEECDLLILPRMTIVSGTGNFVLPQRLYRLSQDQIDAIREFVRKGKPLFVLLGPTNEPGVRAIGAEDDNLEALLSELGLVFGKQTILYNVETKQFAELGIDPFGGGGSPVKIPSVLFENPAPRTLTGETEVKPNPLGRAMRIVARSTGQELDLPVRYPRPVYYSTARPKPDYLAEFLYTDPGTWNEEKPFPERNYTPRYDPPKPDDPKKGTRDEERRGPFPIGVAVETTVPPGWLSPKYRAFQAASLVGGGLLNAGAVPAGVAAAADLPEDLYAAKDPNYKPVPVRIAALGQGGLFNSAEVARPDLAPAKEELLLTTCNWLLGRDDRLPRDDREWRYPRLNLSDRDQFLWRWGAFLGLPLLFAYLGFIVLLIRRMR
ncbi:MAG: hypothetical protein ACJ8F7_14205 [Gemmataceae bacterium]